MWSTNEFPEKVFSTKTEMLKELKANKQTLIAQKKMATKLADPICSRPSIQTHEKDTNSKSASDKPEDYEKIKVSLVINTTKLMDSHSDVHIDGIWNKSVKEKKDLYLLQEHQMKFHGIITDEVKASVKEVTWKELGQAYSGKTQALVFDAEISKDRNPYMFEQYSKGRVKNHSVGMRYVKMELAVNDDDSYFEEEKANWDKFIDQVANKEEAIEQGYFWPVLEAKIIEGSAVPLGSNTATPTLNMEPLKSTLNPEPSADDTQKEKLYNEILTILRK